MNLLPNPLQLQLQQKNRKLLRYKQLLPLKWITTDIPAQPEPADLG